MNKAILLLLVLVLPLSIQAGWRDWLEKLDGSEQEETTSSKTESGSLSESDMVGGLKQALEKGARHAVTSLGKQDGFLADARVRIPMPERLRWVEKTLRKLKLERYADRFVVTMNRAAEKAVLESAPIFTRAIKNMSIEDAVGILRGNDNAATEYFRKHTGDEIHQKMLPITRDMTAKTGVTSAYKVMVDNLGFAKRMLDEDAVDLDGYVTRKAVDGLFLMIAEEEKKIRENPVARTTDLLKKVFRSIGSE